MEVSGPVAAAIVSAMLGGAFSWAVSRGTKNYDSTRAASAAEINARAQLVQDMQKELVSLREALNNAWEQAQVAAEKHRVAMQEADIREREAFQKYQRDMEALDKKWRHLARNLLTRDVMLRRLLHRKGVPQEEIPEFSGFEEFEREGGTVPEDWAQVFFSDASESSLAAPDVLIVDQDDNLARVWQRVLEHEGYRCRRVRNGGEAVVVTKFTWPRLLIIDLSVNDEGGVRLIDQFRQAGYGGKAIAVTRAPVSAEITAPGRFAEVLLKPLLQKDLCDAVKRHYSGNQDF